MNNFLISNKRVKKKNQMEPGFLIRAFPNNGCLISNFKAEGTSFAQCPALPGDARLMSQEKMVIPKHTTFTGRQSGHILHIPSRVSIPKFLLASTFSSM